MSATLCRGCGQPLGASDAACTNCGVPAMPATNGQVAAMAATPTAPVQAVTTEVPTVDQMMSTPPQPAPQVWAESTVPMVASAAPSNRVGSRRIALTLAMALLLGLVARVGLGAMTHKPDNGDLVAQLPVGAAGGAATFDNGGKITVPKGAVDKAQTINIYRKTIDRRVTALSPTGGAPLIFPPGALIVYQFGPVGLVFLQPIIVVLPIPAGQNGIVFIDRNGRITFLPGVGTGRTIRVAITSFNINAPGAVTFAG